MSSYGLWLGAAGMKVNEHRQTIFANNMANAHTTGFKHDLAVVTQRLIESRESPAGSRFASPTLDGMTGGVNVRPTYHNFAQGPIERTGQPLDVAIEGPGFFAVSDGAVTRYTRDGEFARNRNGELVLAAGDGRWRLLGEDGFPILLGETGGPVSVGADGTIREGQTVAGRLTVMAPDHPGLLRKAGENLFEARGTEVQPIETRLVPESREGSNFDVMQGLAAMIEASRAYQMNATMIQLSDQMTGQAVSRVGRVA